MKKNQKDINKSEIKVDLQTDIEKKYQRTNRSEEGWGEQSEEKIKIETPKQRQTQRNRKGEIKSCKAN